MHVSTTEKDNSEMQSAMILVANEVWEVELQEYITLLQQKEIPSQIVGNRIDFIYDSQGRPVHIDTYLGQLNVGELPDILIIPNGQNCIKALLSDPRVHLLVKQIIERGGKVVAAATALLLMRNVGLLTPKNTGCFVKSV